MSDTGSGSAWLESPSGVRVPIRERLAVGRTRGNDLILPSEKISRRHAFVQRQGELEFWISDLGSRNGSHVNGKPLVQPQRLHDGDRIGLGDDEFVFRQHGGPPPRAPAGENTATTMQDIRERTCWFLVGDIEGFTAMSQILDARALGRLIGSWIAECRDLVEGHGGTLNKFLGDGFFAYWPCREGIAEKVARAAIALRDLQAKGDPPFRVVLHHGIATFSGQLSGEVVIGPEVNFTFRMEKVAKDLGFGRLLSAPAAERLAPVVMVRPAGRCGVAGFSGRWDFLTFD